MQTRACGGDPIAVVAECACAGYRADQAGGRVHPADAMARLIPNEDISGAIDKNTSWVVQIRGCGGDAVAVEAGCLRAGYGPDHAGLCKDRRGQDEHAER